MLRSHPHEIFEKEIDEHEKIVKHNEKDTDSSNHLLGTYNVTLSSESLLGVFKAYGTADIVPMRDGQYSIKAILKPIDPPYYALHNPLYIHAIGTEKPGNEFFCKGKVYLSSGFFHKTIENDVTVTFTDAKNAEHNKYYFALNPFTLWGFSPGKVTNTGSVDRVSLGLTAEASKELEFCDQLTLAP